MSIQNQLITISKAMNVIFTLNDQKISYEEVFKDSGMLPALARRADQLSSLCLGYGIGVSFDEHEQSRLGTRVVFDDVTPDIIRVLCIVDVIFELLKSSVEKDRVALDELMYD